MERSGRRNADSVLIAALAGGVKVEDAAKVAGVSTSTVYRRQKVESFRAQVEEARAAMLSEAVGQLARLSSDAAMTLGLLLAKGTPATVRLGAARAILELGAKLRETEVLEARIAELEARLVEPGGGRRWAS